MESFVYHMPTEIRFGPGSEDGAAELVRKYGGRRVLVVYGGGSAVKSGLIGRLTAQLEAAGLTAVPFGGAQPNPRLAHAREGAALARAQDVDFILAVGGGSAIDTAKAIAHGAANPGTELWDFWLGKAALTRTTPVGVVLTIPAAGSETSDSAVLTNGDAKRGLNSSFNRPVFAILDPRLAATLPKFQVACGVTDILMHTLDRYFNPVSDNETTDALAEALLRTVLRNGPAALENPGNLHAMSELMWCGSLSHNGLTGLGGKKDFAVHQLGHAISAKYDVAHGVSLSAVWPAWARYVAGADGFRRFAQFARRVWAVDEAGDEAAARLGIERQTAFFRSLGMPVSLPELGFGVLTEGDLADLAARCSYGHSRTIGSFRVLDEAAMAAIYRAANQA